MRDRQDHSRRGGPPGAASASRAARAGKPPPAGKRPRSPSGPHHGDGPAILYGWHTVMAALQNPDRRIRHLWTTENAARRLAEEGVTAPARARDGAARCARLPARRRRAASGHPRRGRSLPRPTSPTCRRTASCSSSTRSPTRTMSAPSCARRRPSRVGAIVTTARHSAGGDRRPRQGCVRRARICADRERAKSRARLETLKERGFLLVGLDSAGEPTSPPPTCGAAGAGARRGRKGPAPAHARDLRPWRGSTCRARSRA